jgi:hypothetical protein
MVSGLMEASEVATVVATAVGVVTSAIGQDNYASGIRARLSFLDSTLDEDPSIS